MLAVMDEVHDPPRYPLALTDRAGEPFDIRPFETADRPQLDAFYADFEPKRVAQGLPPEGAERIRRWLDAVLGAGVHLLALRGGALVGHALLVPTDDAGTAEYAVFLRASDRGRGLGSDLSHAAVAAAGAAGLRRLWLTVSPHNRPAIRSYESAGFRFRPTTIYSPEAEMELTLRPA